MENIKITNSKLLLIIVYKQQFNNTAKVKDY